MASPSPKRRRNFLQKLAHAIVDFVRYTVVVVRYIWNHPPGAFHCLTWLFCVGVVGFVIFMARTPGQKSVEKEECILRLWVHDLASDAIHVKVPPPWVPDVLPLGCNSSSKVYRLNRVLNEDLKKEAAKTVLDQISKQFEQIQGWCLTVLGGTLGVIMLFVKQNLENTGPKLLMKGRDILLSSIVMLVLCLVAGALVQDVLANIAPEFYGATYYSNTALLPQDVPGGIKLASLGKIQFVFLLGGLANLANFCVTNFWKLT